MFTDARTARSATAEKSGRFARAAPAGGGVAGRACHSGTASETEVSESLPDTTSPPRKPAPSTIAIRRDFCSDIALLLHVDAAGFTHFGHDDGQHAVGEVRLDAAGRHGSAEAERARELPLAALE